MPEVVITAANVDLTNCAKEQIHIPQSIQPHGAMVIVDETLTILATSQNTAAFLGLEPGNLVDRPLSDLLDSATLDRVTACLNQDLRGINPIRVQFQNRDLNLIVHRNLQDYIILEFEAIDPQYMNDFIGFHHMTAEVIDEVQKSMNLQELSEVIVRNIRRLTNFDRVMIYRFDRDGSGYVLAEAKDDRQDSFLGMHYPATDIPAPARRLYLLNYIRLIADVDYPAVALSPHPHSDEPFDLSYATLRSVSPIHLEYLKNMGVQASMSISIIYNKELWGLIACHHYQPRFLAYEVRCACEFLGKIMSLQLIAQSDRQNEIYKTQIRDRLSQLISKLSQATRLTDVLYNNLDLVQNLIGAQGLVLQLEGQIHSVGQVPTIDQTIALIDWLKTTQDPKLFYTDRLPALYAPAQEFPAIASGVLVLHLSQVEPFCFLWFRPEVAQTVHWAGNPHKKAVLEEDGSITLSPRQSFQRWQETVMGQSLPWLTCEIQQVQELRNLLVDIIFKKSNELVTLNLELQQSNEELDSFAYIASHDLKEPLRGIYNYSYLLLDDYQLQLDADGLHKLQMLMSLSKRMEKLIDALLHYSRLGRQDLNLESIDVREIIIQDIKLILEVSQQESLDIRIAEDFPPFLADKTLVEEVLMNLITNSLKYNDNEDKWVEVGHLRDPRQSRHPILFVRDNGIGIAAEHQKNVFRIFKRLHGQKAYGGGTGAGLTIVKKIIDRHKGRIWIESTPGAGTTFFFTLAAESAEFPAPPARDPRAAPLT